MMLAALTFGGAVRNLPSDSYADLVYKFFTAVATADFENQSFSLRDLSTTIHDRGGGGKISIALKGFDGAQLLDYVNKVEAQTIQTTALNAAINLPVIWKKLFLFWSGWYRTSDNHSSFPIAVQDVGKALDAFSRAQSSRGLHPSAESAGWWSTRASCFTKGTHKYSHDGREYSYTVKNEHGDSGHVRPCMFYLPSVDSFKRQRDTAEWWSSVFVIVSPCLKGDGDETWVHDLALYLFTEKEDLGPLSLTPEQKKREGIGAVVVVGLSLGANVGLTCMTSRAFAECMTTALFVGAYIKTSERDGWEAITSALKGNAITLVASPIDECVPWLLLGEFFQQCGEVGLTVVHADFCHEDLIMFFRP